MVYRLDNPKLSMRTYPDSYGKDISVKTNKLVIDTVI